ncbi:MAG: hypothetical protein U0795_14945 [Pirellulales bacterium]
MRTYNPNLAPDPEVWLELDEGLRISLASQWHKRARVKLPNRQLHAALHVIVENQIAQNLECVTKAMPRLMSQGLSRHDAIHAISWIFVTQIYDKLSGDLSTDQVHQLQANYEAEVERLTAEAWLKQERS